MIDVKLPVRKAFYDLLNGALTYQGSLVPVVDDMKNLGDASTLWVLLSNQTGADSSTFQTFDSDETIVLDVVYKGASRVNKEQVDNVVGQILPLALPAPGSNGLNPFPSVQINCVKVSSDQYLTTALNSSNSVIRRLVTFRMHVRQTGLTTPTPPIPSFRNPVVSADFNGNPMSYANGNLKNRTFLLFLNGIGFLDLGTQWQHLQDGGFQILLNNFDATLNSYTFYLLLQ
jgi:hypothetical protein